jgi:hypothetical protein
MPGPDAGHFTSRLRVADFTTLTISMPGLKKRSAILAHRQAWRIPTERLKVRDAYVRSETTPERTAIPQPGSTENNTLGRNYLDEAQHIAAAPRTQ